MSLKENHYMSILKAWEMAETHLLPLMRDGGDAVLRGLTADLRVLYASPDCTVSVYTSQGNAPPRDAITAELMRLWTAAGVRSPPLFTPPVPPCPVREDLVNFQKASRELMAPLRGCRPLIVAIHAVYYRDGVRYFG